MPEAHEDENARRAQVLLHGSAVNVTAEHLKVVLYQVSNKLGSFNIAHAVWISIVAVIEESGVTKMLLQLESLSDFTLQSVAESLFQQAFRQLDEDKNSLRSKQESSGSSLWDDIGEWDIGQLEMLPSWRIINWLLSSGQNPNTPIRLEQGGCLTPLQMAVDIGCPQLIHVLLDAKSGPNLTYDDPDIPARRLLRGRHISSADKIQVLKRFSKDAASVSFSENEQPGSLPKAMLEGLEFNRETPNLELLDFLIDDEPENYLEYRSLCPLGWERRMAHAAEVAMILLDAGAVLTEDDIRQAIKLSNWALIDRLLEKDHVGIWQREEYMLLLMAAIASDKQHLVTEVFKRFPNAYTAGALCASVFFEEDNFVKHERMDKVQVLLLYGNHSIDESNHLVYYGRSPLQMAAEIGNLDLIHMLLDAGADVNSPAAQSYGATALQIAAIKGHLGVAKILVDLGANVNAPGATGEGGRTALEGAAEHGRIDTIQYLLSQGVETNAKGRIPYLRAIRYAELEGHMAAAKLLKTWREWAADDDALWDKLQSLPKDECERFTEKDFEDQSDSNSESERHSLRKASAGGGMQHLVFDDAPAAEAHIHESSVTANPAGGIISELEDLEMMTSDTFAFWSEV
ncbi:hypothetical protein CGLO_14638 [Colletotrichum gloeosporioides Cg-14]|uniref:Uncharacterized protein n=1 Tax=Colletotrichum gloeosporioides (strain Cg-14) TaxID=1237896 RepID=T0K0M6_COLGC|nr:hypothetical protein CGLO_14638 [Colletotrichum gloeosporioides Cg-14]